MGHRLFVREIRGVSLTPAGSLVVEHAARILAGVTALQLDVDSLGDRLAGRVAVGAFPAAMSVLVPHAVATLGIDHPGLRVTLAEASTPTLLRDVRSARVDLVVIGAGAGLPDYDLDGLSAHRIFAGDLCVAVPAGHRLSASTSVHVGELAGEAWISGIGSAGDPQFAAWPTLVDPVIRYRVRGWPARLGLVAAGLGVCLLPELAARSVPAGVTVIGVDDPTWPGRYTMAVSKKKPSAAVMAVVAAFRSAADDLKR